jgi:catalase
MARLTGMFPPEGCRMSAFPLLLRRTWPLAAIALVLALLACAFAWAAGWIGTQRLTAQRFTNAIEANNGKVYPGYRRAHGKGVCVTGRFTSSGAAAALSRASLLAPGAVTPVLGRLSIAGADPHAPDAMARVRSMALQLTGMDGQQWRMAMNSFPFFVVATPQGFYDQAVASRPDPATGKPDPAKMAELLRKHPEIAKFQQWAKTAPWSNSWANTQFNGVNAFRFIDAAGHVSFVRWSMRPQLPFAAMDPAQRKDAEADYLTDDLSARLARGPLRWDMVVTVAAAADPIDDPAALATKPPAGGGRHAGVGCQSSAVHRRLPRHQLRPDRPARRHRPVRRPGAGRARGGVLAVLQPPRRRNRPRSGAGSHRPESAR